MHTRLPAAIVVVLAMTSGCRGTVNATSGAPIPQTAQLNVSFPPPPLFIRLPHFGFYVGVGTFYDIVYVHDNYYLYYGETWYRAPNFKGPWTAVPSEVLPPVIRKQRIESIRKDRDMEYRLYRRDKTHYRGRIFRPDR
jgi:hypothetical protein